jgi:chemotaxis family two-component system sensor kinase Cph1
VDQLLPIAQEKGIELSVSCPPGLPPVRADRQRLLQALGNLLGNALKFTPGGGKVHLSGEASSEGVCISVADTGPGIAPENLQSIFESFWKTHDGNDTGTGLGLGIARGIVEMHGGHVAVESELGRGTVFTVTLPAAEPE